ncbi:MAG TPA: SSI family serine proteinase inhibitor [Propionibacteriaceae bacterium]|nr:SSI family serine proteinase inhibitor [Propionibacteriaceae bacterium]
MTSPARVVGSHLVLVAVLALSWACQQASTSTPDPRGDTPRDPSERHSTPSATTTATTTAAAAELTIVFDDGSGKKLTWRLTCNPTGGDHPASEDACTALAARGGTALTMAPRTRICTQQYGGPQTATVTGSWGDRQVVSRFSRRNGCEISRWDALVPLLPASAT